MIFFLLSVQHPNNEVNYIFTWRQYDVYQILQGLYPSHTTAFLMFTLSPKEAGDGCNKDTKIWGWDLGPYCEDCFALILSSENLIELMQCFVYKITVTWHNKIDWCHFLPYTGPPTSTTVLWLVEPFCLFYYLGTVTIILCLNSSVSMINNMVR